MLHVDGAAVHIDEQYQSLRDLWSAVMHLALEDAVGIWRYNEKGATTTSVMWSARHWIKSECRTTGSFLWICATLGLNPDVVRETVHSNQLRHRQPSRGMRHAA
jgi:hypothetical protein